MTECVRGEQFALCLNWEGNLVRSIDVHWSDAVRESGSPSEHVARLKAALIRYESRKEPDWPDLPLCFAGLSEFQRDALAELRRIPAGTTLTYGELAALLGRPQGAQAVGRAMGANPFPVLYPCHRVVGKDGSMTGFSASGGIEMKKALLRLEGAAQGVLPLVSD